MQEYSLSKSEMTELYQIRKSYEKYIRKERERNKKPISLSTIDGYQ